MLAGTTMRQEPTKMHLILDHAPLMTSENSRNNGAIDGAKNSYRGSIQIRSSQSGCEGRTKDTPRTPESQGGF